MLNTTQPNFGSISGVTTVTPPTLGGVEPSNGPSLGYVTDNPNQQGQVAPLDDNTTAKMVSMLTQAQQQYPGQEEQILNQFIADNQDKYPAQMGKIQSFLTSNDGSRTQRNNNPTAMTTDVAQSLGLEDGVDYTQGDPFKDAQGETLYTAKLMGDPISATVSAFDKAASDNTPIFTTASGKPRWSYINMTNQQWEDLSPQDKVATVKHMQSMENGPGGSATQPSGFSPKSVLASLIADNQSQTPQQPQQPQQTPQDRSGGFFSRLGQDLGNRYQTLVGENQEVNQGKMGPVGFGFDIAGQLAGAAGDVLGEGATSAFRGFAPQISQKGLQMIGNSPLVQNAENTIGGLYSQFQQAHPVGAGHLAAATNIAMLAPALLGSDDVQGALSDKYMQQNAEDWVKPVTSNMKTFGKAADIYDMAKSQGTDIGQVLSNNKMNLSDYIDESGKYSTADAADKLRTDAGTASKQMLRPALAQADLTTPKTPVSDLMSQSLNNVIEDKGLTVETRNSLLNKLITTEADMNAEHPNGMSLTDLHDEKITRDLNAKYNPVGDIGTTQEALKNKAIADAARKLVETKAPPEIPVHDFNAELSKQYQAANYLDQLDSKTAPKSLGAKIRGYAGKIVGAKAGSMIGGGVGNVLGGIAGYHVGGFVESMLENMSSPLKTFFLNNLETTNPEAFTKILNYLKTAPLPVTPPILGK